MKLIKEEDKDHKTLSKENKRLEIFMIIFMVIAICFGTFYFNVICFGTECETKTPRPFIIIGSNKTSSKEVGNNEDDAIQKRIVSGYWYSEGTLLFFNNGVFSVGRYGTDGGYNGMVGEFKKGDTENSYNFNVVHNACTENCMEQSNDYKLNVKLEYTKSPEENIFVSSIVKTENGQDEELRVLEKTYKFAGNSFDEVEQYVNKLNN